MKKARRILVTAGLAAVAVAALAPSAMASAKMCNPGFQPTSCVHVQGGGLHVAYVRPGTSLHARQTSTGVWHVYGPGLDYWSPLTTVRNKSWFSNTTAWGPTVSLNRSFNDGQTICAAWHRRNGDGSWSYRGASCARIHR